LSPAEVDLYTQIFMGNDILKIVQSPASKVPAYSFNDKNFPAIV